jgi:methyl-accepting chemotaxis protein
VQTSKVQKRFAKLEVTAGGIALQQKVGEIRKKYLSARDAMLQKLALDDADATREGSRVFQAVVADYLFAMSKVVDFEGARNQALGAQVDSAMDRMRQTAERIAAGNLSVDLKASSTDEVGCLVASLRKMQHALRSLVAEIRLSVDSAQRRRRSGARRRAGPRLCGRRFRSQNPGTAQRQRSVGNQAADRRQRGPGRRRLQTDPVGRRHARRDGH